MQFIYATQFQNQNAMRYTIVIKNIGWNTVVQP